MEIKTIIIFRGLLFLNSLILNHFYLQEIVSIYPVLSPPNLTPAQSNRVCNALALLQVICFWPFLVLLLYWIFTSLIVTYYSNVAFSLFCIFSHIVAEGEKRYSFVEFLFIIVLVNSRALLMRHIFSSFFTVCSFSSRHKDVIPKRYVLIWWAHLFGLEMCTLLLNTWHGYLLVSLCIALFFFFLMLEVALNVRTLCD